MAIIYSNRNDNSGSHTSANALATSTWAGGVVPGAADQVYVVGRRTTISSTYYKWAGSTQTINVASTSNFASSGFFYTHTSGGDIVKINYTGTTATSFTGCSVDESDPFYTWVTSPYNSYLASGYYVHNPAYIIDINDGQTFECNELIIQEGGWLRVNAGGTLKLNQGMIVRDGRLLGQSTGTITITRPAGTTSVSTVGYLNAENYYLSVIDIDGGENRVYSTLAANCNVGDASVTITGANNGSFAVGDEVAIYGHDNYRRRNIGYIGYRDATCNLTGEGMDEGFDVVGVSGNTLFLAIKNGAAADIKGVATVGSQKVIEVHPDSIYFNAGDNIVVNNAIYTVDSVEDSQYQVYHYDFTNPNTDLSDFWVDDSTHVYSGGWNIQSGVGLRNTSGGYRELVHKYLWERDVVVEAEMSPLDGYSSGTRGGAAYGLLSSYDPAFRWGHRGYDSFKTDYLVIDDANQDFYFGIRSMNNYANNRPDRNTAILNATRTAATYKVDTRKGLTTVYFNGDEFTQEFRRDGNFKGLVGLYTNANSQFRCKRMTIWVPTQKLYVTTNSTIPSTGRIYRTGAEMKHFAGDRIVKLSSINTGDGSHRDYAFAYRGARGDGIWPQVVQLNGANTTNSSMPFMHNHDMNIDYYYDAGSSVGPYSITFDLINQTQFTHVSFVPRMAESTGNGYFNGFNGVTIYGSNDLTNWTTIYAQANDTKKWYGGSYNRMGFYPTGTVTYRYVKFETRGDQGGTNRNRYVNFGVHDFSNGYTLTLNNTSDLAIGDTITVMSDSGYGWSSREYEAYYARILANTDPETYMHGGWATECTITNKVGNTIYLDKPIFWGYVEDSDSVTVVKTNRNFVIQGTIGTNNVFSDSWRWPNIYTSAGSNVGRRYLFRHIRFNYIGSYRYSGSANYNRGFTVYSYDYWNHTVLDGCVHNFGPDGTTWTGIGAQYANMIARNNVVMNMYSGYWLYYNSSYTGSGLFNNKILGTFNGFYADGQKALAVNYNEVATCDAGINSYTHRVDRMVIPFFNEIRHNLVKGTSNRGFSINAETVGPRRLPRMRLDYNKVRASDDYAISGQIFDGWPMEGFNALAEHTGSRLSRYRNEGFMSEGDTSSDLSAVFRQTNFGRYGYDLLKGVYHHYYRDPANPEVTRVFNPNGDDHLAILGIEIEVLEDVPFEIVVQYDWRIPVMATLQDDGNGRGAMFTYSLQNGTRITSNYTANPPNTITPNVWNTAKYTFNTFTSTAGKAAVYLARDALNGYVDLKNGSARVYTDYPDAINVIGNTFDMSNLWNQHRSKRDLYQKTKANARTININRLKF